MTTTYNNYTNISRECVICLEYICNIDGSYAKDLIELINNDTFNEKNLKSTCKCNTVIHEKCFDKCIHQCKKCLICSEKYINNPPVVINIREVNSNTIPNNTEYNLPTNFDEVFKVFAYMTGLFVGVVILMFISSI